MNENSFIPPPTNPNPKMPRASSAGAINTSTPALRPGHRRLFGRPEDRPDRRRTVFQSRLGFRHSDQPLAALDDFHQAIAIDPVDADSRYQRGLTYAALGVYALAVEDYTAAVELDDEHCGTYFQRGLAYRHLRDWPAAVADYTRVLELKPASANAYNNRGIVYAPWRLPTGHRDYNTALKIDPKHEAAYDNRGTARLHQRDYAGAIATTRRPRNRKAERRQPEQPR